MQKCRDAQPADTARADSTRGAPGRWSPRQAAEERVRDDASWRRSGRHAKLAFMAGSYLSLLSAGFPGNMSPLGNRKRAAKATPLNGLARNKGETTAKEGKVYGKSERRASPREAPCTSVVVVVEGAGAASTRAMPSARAALSARPSAST